MTIHNTLTVPDAGPPSATTPVSAHGFRNHFGHILPKHSLFQVNLHIESLSNVPLVGGDFGVRWKFKNVQSGSRLLGKMKHRSVSSPLLMSEATERSKESSDSAISAMSDNDDGRSSVDNDSLSSHTNLHSQSTNALQSNGSSVYGEYLTPAPPETAHPPSAATPTPRPRLDKHDEARGMTQWAPLKAYTVKWEHDISVVVQMDVHRETGDLLPCELKLVVMQRVIQGDPNAPHQPRLGAVYINLAEYADAGPVTRRYLLRESKTNATLKLTLEVVNIGGEKHYTAPPLRKGEIMASVTGLLANNGLYGTTLARDLDLYTRADDEDWADANGHVDLHRLASSNGLRTTENLIDALFNPLPTASEQQSPFTYYDPDKAHEAEKAAWKAERQSTHSSLDSTLTDTSQGKSPSVYTAGSESSSSTRDQHKHWWQKMRSRPGTPQLRAFRPSTPQLSSRVPS